MEKSVSNKKTSSSDDDDDVIVIDSDTEDCRSSSPKKATPAVVAEIIDLDDDEGEQIDVNELDLIWGSDEPDQPSTGVTTEIRRPKYNLESSSSDDDSPPENIYVSPQVNKLTEPSRRYMKPVVPVIPQVQKVQETRKISETEKLETILKVQKKNQVQEKKVAYVQPKVHPPKIIQPSVHKKPQTKTVNPSIYVPLSVNPKHTTLRAAIRQKFNFLPNAASNFSLKSGARVNNNTQAHKILLSAKKKAIIKKSPMKSASVRIPPENSRVKPAVASNVPNTSRMGFLLNAAETKKSEKHPLINSDPRIENEKQLILKRDTRVRNETPVTNRDPRMVDEKQITNRNPRVQSDKQHIITRDPRLNRATSVNASTSEQKPPPTINTTTQLQRSTSEFLADIRNKKIIINTSSTADDKNKKVKHRDSDYDINDVLRSKRLKREMTSTSNVSIQPKNNQKDNKEKEKEKSSSNSTKPTQQNNAKQSEPGVMPFSKSGSVAPKPVSADCVLIKILHWKLNWVRESEGQSDLPPILNEPLKYIKKSYESVDDYNQHYIPLLLCEIWSQLLDEFNLRKDTLVSVAMVQCNIVGQFAVILGQVAIRKGQNYPRDGDLVFVELPFWESSDNAEHSKRINAFGYISDHSVETITRKTSLASNYKPPEGASHLVKYEIRLKPRSHRLDYNSLMRVRTVLYLKPMIRNIEAVLSLKQSPLCNDILKPRKITSQIITPTSVKLESTDYNNSQYKAILGSVEAISRPYSVPKLLLIQGPPGTGKTHTLVGMIKRIFSDFSKNPTMPKVLVCAPSNGAIDEIGKRLAKDRKFCKDRQLRLVRIGQDKSIHPEMQSFSLERLADNNVRNTISEAKKSYEEKKKQIEDKMSALDQEIANHNAVSKWDEAKKCQKEINRLGQELIAHSMENGKFEDNENDLEKKKKRLKIDLLMKADVILSTLNSCRSSIVEQVFNGSRAENGFTCVIIDEASQCTEPEILMPLIYTSVSKMILIGDPMQLPATVVSKEATRRRFGTSLFERLYSYFGENESQSPILMLDIQYRMHQDICKFPSKRFYGERLKTCLSVLQRKFPIKPYIVFNVIQTVHSKKDPKNIFNENEAQFVMKLLTAMGDCVEHSTRVGIITPYNGQKKLLEQKISLLKPKLSPQINTIDGFQGQEMDVIILSCVRSREGESDGVNIGFLSSYQRINVALTRAKFALIICVAAQTLRNNELWDSLIEDATSRGCFIQTGAQASIDKIKQCIKL